MSATFGASGFFGCGYMASSTDSSTSSSTAESQSLQEATPAIAGWWSTYPSPTPEDGKSFNKDQAINDVLARHEKWKNPTIQAILAYIRSQRASNSDTGLIHAVFATYTTPPLPSYSAHKGRLVLIGDAAHTLQTSTGQGASQALEDAESYVRLLAHYLKHPESASTPESPLSRSATAYTTIRQPRVMTVYKRGQKMGGMKRGLNIVEEYLTYFFIWLMSTVPSLPALSSLPSLNSITPSNLSTAFFPDNFNKQLMSYDVPSEVDRIIKSQAASSALPAQG
jgi:FAD binding domain